MKNLILFISFLLLSSCAEILYLDLSLQGKQRLSKPNKDYVKSQEKFTAYINGIKMYDQQFLGISVYDMNQKKYVIDYNQHKYFTPASNVKLFSFFAGLNFIGDSIPSLRYISRNDSLIFWGTGDPTFLHQDLQDSVQKTFHFLKNSPKKLFFSSNNFDEQPLGYGWAWDDYQEYFSAEKSSFPIYGNIVRFDLIPKQDLQTSPAYFRQFSKLKLDLSKDEFKVNRDWANNNFRYSYPNLKEKVQTDVPFKSSDSWIVRLLSDTLKKDVQLIDLKMPDSAKVLYSNSSKEMYRRMLQVSDNFLAEQILLLCAQKLKSNLINSDSLIKLISKKKLTDLTDPPVWVDGSGLSRYNLFTPHSFVEILLKIYELKAKDQENETELFDLLPTGGKTGTIRNMYKDHAPFIFAKTGTLSNNHCLSGYLLTKSGKKLCFSFMNNHFVGNLAEVKLQMSKIMTDFYLYY
ncbi:MAG: hypothetical protein EAZ97_11580 [Bacteroidetes bacterium]|nr:MAG: hypothetical protein EAZ97_11580 [Bacteroidota bacterium]